MRKLLTSAATTLAFCASILSASAQSSDSTFIANPYVAGSPNVFAAAVLQVNNDAFFAGTDVNGFHFTQAGLWNGTTSDEALRAAKAFRLSDIGNTFSYYGSSSKGAVTSQNTTTIVLTGFENSQNPAKNSSGVTFPNTSGVTISNISFQYSPLSGLTGLVTNDWTQAPALAITDEGGSRTRLLPITSGLLATNAALNAYNGAFGTSSTTLSEGFLTSSWTPAQLGIRGSVTQVGLVYARSGVCMIQGFTINGTTVDTFVVDNINGYPF